MLAPDTKRHIDAARQVLVGKVPDPKSQIEQITNALVYKFMDDMDEQSAALGGKRRYFVGDYEKYGWRRLMNESLGAHDRLTLYREALEGMSKNPNLPELFRSIFRNAYLPFNDARTLTLFLKEVNFFSYENSEELGNGYEYLLSIMGSQGDAGQFRTPRHIIDFIVEAVNPTKDDSVLDPACGTAGFLISAYKHVMAQHDGKNDITGVFEQNELPLSADERKKLYHSYHGFDIDDNMVKMAKVNMYLHSFPEPNITVHDSLSSEDHWDERYDVILANPPFMSPKGGIVPHKKFGIEANRAEVLFVDYIASHLKPTGRAGIVVPEGIIFQNGNAYKALRKNLVENYLYAVVSLPAGVFQPYSGVKTCTLLLDKELAKQRDEVLFVKIDNDGLSFGTQRREVAGNQLTRAVEAIKVFQKGEETSFEFAHAVAREQIIESGDYNLSGDRYKAVRIRQHKDWSMVKLIDIIELQSGSRQKGGSLSMGIPSIGGRQIGAKGDILHDKMEFVSKDHFNRMKSGVLRPKDVLVVKDGATTGKTGRWLSNEPAAVNEHVYIFRALENQVNPDYLYFVVSGFDFQKKLERYIKGIIGGISREILEITIPLPAIEIQREIAVELDDYHKIIDAAQSIVKTYKPIIKINPDWTNTNLENIAELIQRGKSPKYGESNIQVIKSGQARGFYEFDFSTIYNTVPGFPLDHRRLQDNDLLINSTGVGTAGRVTLYRAIQHNHPCLVDSHITILRLDQSKAISDFVLYALAEVYGFDGIERLASGSGGQIELGLTTIKAMEIPLPSLEEQKQIVAVLEAEQKLIDANKKLIEIYTQKIKSKIAEVWGE